MAALAGNMRPRQSLGGRTTPFVCCKHSGSCGFEKKATRLEPSIDLISTFYKIVGIVSIYLVNPPFCLMFVHSKRVSISVCLSLCMCTHALLGEYHFRHVYIILKTPRVLCYRVLQHSMNDRAWTITIVGKTCNV